jgi:sensor histidine kinase YesM
MKWLRRWLLICGGWVLFGLFNATQTIVTRITQARINYNQLYGFCAIDALAWLLLTPLVLRMAPKGLRWPVLVLFHFVAGIAVGLLHLEITVQLLPFIGYHAPPRISLFRALMPVVLQYDFFVYWILAGILYSVNYYRQARERELNLTQARLEVLRAQLQPHFLFNTLNTISSLMYKDVPAADRVLNRLASFLRLALETAKTQEVCLATELEYTDRYLDIERVRFMDRLKVERQIEEDTLDAMVPTLILQPLVENALKHGVGTRAGGGTMWIRAQRRNGTLSVEVEDEGWPPREVQEGVGLSNARARLVTLYGERQRLWIDQGASGGFRVSMELPYHT